MRYRLLGTSGLRVSDLALGTMTFSAEALPRGERPSPGATWSWCATESDARLIFAGYLQAGGNFIDTADVYAGGTSEPLVAELIRPHRDRLVVATKFGLSTDDTDVGAGGSSFRTARRAVDRSLRRLGTDRIDLLWLHAWDGVTPLDEVVDGLDRLVQAGKVLYIGISDTPAWAIATMHTLSRMRGRVPITAIQLRYSALDRAAELELLPMAAHLGFGVVAFGVLAGGALSRRSGQPTPSRRGDQPLQADQQVVRDIVDGIAGRRGITPAQVAIAWVRSMAPSVVPIVGARTVAQFTEALGALDVTFDPEELTALNDAGRPASFFPHDVTDAVRSSLRGGSAADLLDLPPSAAF